MIQPQVHAVYKLFPWIRHFPGYYGGLYRNVIRGRTELHNLVQDMKVSLLSAMCEKLDFFRKQQKWRKLGLTQTFPRNNNSLRSHELLWTLFNETTKKVNLRRDISNRYTF